jgi:hypothetical protein
MIRNVTAFLVMAILASLGRSNSVSAQTTQAWPAGQVVYFPEAFPEGVKPWATRIAEAIRRQSARDLAEMVVQGESAAAVLTFWGQYGRLRDLYFSATYDLTTDSFTLADSSGRVCACTGSRTADGYRLGRCRALPSQQSPSSHISTASSAATARGARGAPCATTVAAGNTGPRRVVLSGGAAVTLFDKYVELADGRGATVDYTSLVVFVRNEQGTVEEIVGGKPGLAQLIMGSKPRVILRKKLELLVAHHLLHANAEAEKRGADLVCGSSVP